MNYSQTIYMNVWVSGNNRSHIQYMSQSQLVCLCVVQRSVYTSLCVSTWPDPLFSSARQPALLTSNLTQFGASHIPNKEMVSFMFVRWLSVWLSCMETWVQCFNARHVVLNIWWVTFTWLLLLSVSVWPSELGSYSRLLYARPCYVCVLHWAINISIFSIVTYTCMYCSSVYLPHV